MILSLGSQQSNPIPASPSSSAAPNTSSKRNNQPTDNIPSILDNPILNPRSSRGNMGGQRFPARGGSGPPRGRGGFNQRGPPGGGGNRQRWDGPMGQQVRLIIMYLIFFTLVLIE